MQTQYLIGIALLAVVSHGQKLELLVPNYDNVEHQIKGFTIREPLVLHCNVTRDVDEDLVWEKDGKEVSEIDELENRYRILEDEHKFIIRRTLKADVGLYSCRLNNERKDFNVVANLAVRTPANIGVSEDEVLVIKCDVVGTKPQLYWHVLNTTIYNSTGRYILKENDDGVENAVLKVVNMSLEDRGEYTCLASNILTKLNVTAPASDVTVVRVKDSLAPLWPALGICVELVVLCFTTILLERYGKKAEWEEEGDD